jgi:hypothetical protein
VARELEGRDGWVVDGNYYGKLGDFVLERADTVVWLDLPLRTSLIRLWHRTLYRIRNDVELWNGNRDSWRGAFWGRESLFLFTIRVHNARRSRWPARFARLPNLDVVRLRTPRDVDAFLASEGRE